MRALLDRYPNPEGFGKTVLYADAVVGWSWIYFKDYDFEKNPLGFSDRILPILQTERQAMMRRSSYADAVGIDFHKVGLGALREQLLSLQERGRIRSRSIAAAGDAYLQVRTPYNPMYYTLEVSRTASARSPAGRR